MQYDVLIVGGGPGGIYSAYELLKNGAPVCVTAVSTATLIPNEFTTAYRSAMFKGRAEVVTDEGEKMKAMLLLCTAFLVDGSYNPFLYFRF